MLIAFTGKAGSGKDECGKWLIAHHGFEKLSFATPLKSMLAAMGYPEPATAAEKEAIIPELNCSWRKLATTLGTEWGRDLIHPDLWVLLAGLKVKHNPGKDYVITDCRFENEATMTRLMRGVVVHLKGRAADATTVETAAHRSEAGVAFKEGDLILHNDVDSIPALHDKLGIALRMFL